ncbi:MAG: hypothetical protein LBR28_01195 [Bacteroidales bacterium]|nr:hypothetical protein [Bacteroidales bacterium]
MTKVHKNRYFIDYPHYVNNVLAEYNLKVRIEHLEKECELRDGKQLKLFDDDDW